MGLQSMLGGRDKEVPLYTAKPLATGRARAVLPGKRVIYASQSTFSHFFSVLFEMIIFRSSGTGPVNDICN